MASCVLMIYCVLNNNTLKLFLIDHIVRYVIKSSTTLRSNLFIYTGQYETEEYGTIAGVILV